MNTAKEIGMLTHEQIKAFNQSGFLHAPGMLSRDWVNDMKAQLHCLFAHQAQKLGVLDTPQYDLETLVYKVMEPNSPHRKAVYELVRHAPAIRATQYHPDILYALEVLGLAFPVSLQVPTVRFDIPGEFEKRYLTRLHQDLRSIRSASCITVWVPLTRIDPKNGSIVCYSGTHKLGMLEHKITDGQIELRKPDVVDGCEEIILEADPCDVVFLNSFCVHKSFRDGSDGSIKINVQFMHNDGFAYDPYDEFAQLEQTVPDYKDLYKY
ncbi:MAG: hypothetical protein CMF69_06640 [Magnetovibrio sp.]|nr:hypothetical protein [Magnetovibrio sp.]